MDKQIVLNIHYDINTLIDIQNYVIEIVSHDEDAQDMAIAMSDIRDILISIQQNSSCTQIKSVPNELLN